MNGIHIDQPTSNPWFAFDKGCYVKVGRDAENLAKDMIDEPLDKLSGLSAYDIIEGNEPEYWDEDDCLRVFVPEYQALYLEEWALSHGLNVGHEERKTA